MARRRSPVELLGYAPPSPKPSPRRPAKERLELRAGDRWVFAGASGTGKTTGMLRLLPVLWKHYKVPTFALNTKPDDTITRMLGPQARYYLRGNSVPKVESRTGLTIWEPDDDIPSHYDQFFRDLLKTRRPAIVVIDELANIGGKNGTDFPLNLYRLLKQARSMKITVITGTQDLAYIPRQVLGQATHLVGFRVEPPHDKKVLADLMRVEPLINPATGRILERYFVPDEHGTYYRRLDRIDSGRYHKSVDTLF